MEENEGENDLRFAVCRRCPKAYHRKCLPRKIGFEDDEEKGIIQRAWEGLLPSKRILIYCLKHEINDELGTPKRNHIKFSSTEDRRRRNIFELQSSRQNLNPALSPREVTGTKARSQTKPLRQNVKEDQITSGSNPLKRVKGNVLVKKFARGPVRRATEKVDRTSSAGENKLGDQLYNFYSRSGLREEIVTNKQVVQKEQISELQLDAESEKRLKHLMRASTYAVTMKEILEKHKGPSTYSYFSREAFDKNITLGKVEAAVEAVRTALEKLESGACVEEAKDICEPRVLTNVLKWKDKLKVYLAPFLYGMRYTSFGRHFTKVDKLEQIVDKLHWYVRNGDMIVDFCCGSNDFSCLLKTKLEETGKKCSFKNFDVLQAKVYSHVITGIMFTASYLLQNDFNFVQKDWFEVTAKELAPGSKLIMGLNPPFGVKAALANKFIDKALEFRPKLLILIVPPETHRLDNKKTSYDLIWEDTELLSGKSFYLPGSVDENNKQLEDWNVTTPLYVWSRHDWTSRVKEIARRRGHVSPNPNQYKGQEKSLEKRASEAVPMEIEEFGSRRLRASEILKRPSPQSYGGCQKDYSDDSTKGRGRGQSEEETKDLSSRKDYRDNLRRCFNSRGQSEERTGEQCLGKAQSEEPRGGIASEEQNNTLDFQPDVPGSGLPFEPPGFGIMDSDISPGPDGIGCSLLANDTSHRDSEMRSLIQNYGRQEPDPFTNHDNHRHFSSLPSATSGDLGAPASASFNDWLNTSAMKRYAPRPDELNHLRTNNAGLDNIYNPRVDQRAGQLHQRPPPGSLGFAYGSPHAFAQSRSSGGWIDD